jgi:hypothetical protein
VFHALSGHNWGVRRLDLRRRGLIDRWNEINNRDDAALPTSVAPAAAGAGLAGSTAVTH